MSVTLRRTTWWLTGLLLIGLVILLYGWWLGTKPAPAVGPRASDLSESSLIQRGAYLAKIGNCAGCHTSDRHKPYAGGRALATPFGTFYGPNITPDPKFGIGRWSSEDFWRALHDGQGPDGQLLYPAFPFTSYTHLSRPDSDALYAYLQQQDAVAEPSRPHELNFPYNQRWLLAYWRALNFRPANHETSEPGVANADTDASLWRQGSYLARGIGHCAECHTPRNALGGLQHQLAWSGSPMPMGDWYAPALTPSKNGLATWSIADIAQLLRAGTSPHGSAAGPMAEVVFESSQYLTPQDAQAIATYLHRLPTTAHSAATPTNHQLNQLSSQRYEQFCASCHGDQGQGKPPGWPSLVGNLTVTLPDPVNAIRMVLDGGFAPGTDLNPQPYGMPPFRHKLSDSDIAAILSYVRQSWGNQASDVAPNDVRKARLLKPH